MDQHDSSELSREGGAEQRVENEPGPDDNPVFPKGAAVPPTGRGKQVLLCLSLLLLVVGTFYPTLHNEFVGFDDPLYVTDNLHVRRGLTWANVKWAFQTTSATNWHPLTWLSHMVDCQLFGLAPWGHHLTSILLHALNTVLVFLLFQRLTGAAWRSFFAAAFFGLHPLRVESVAWVAERKDVLSTFFGLLALLMYARYAQKRSRVESRESKARTPASALDARRSTLDYYLAVFFFALGLMSKPMLVTLPFVMLLLDYWPLGRMSGAGCQVSGRGAAEKVKSPDLSVSPGGAASVAGGDALPRVAVEQPLVPGRMVGRTDWGLVWEKWPFFLMTILASCVTFVAQKQGGTVSTLLPFGARLGNAAVSYCRYLGKLFWPVDLCVYYPGPDRWPLTVVVAACFALVAVSILAWMLRRGCPWLVVGWFWFVGTLVPVIGLVQVGDQALADRYSYIPSLGILLLVLWSVPAPAGRRRFLAAGAVLVGGVLMMGCIVLTRIQIGYWENSEKLFRHALAVTRNNFLAHNNLGNALSAAGQMDGAIAQFQEALRIKPDFAEAHNNLGVSLQKQGRLADAINQFIDAVRLKPDFAEAYYNLGTAFAETGIVEEAIAAFQKAIALKPDLVDARYNLGNGLIQTGRFDDATLQFLEILRIDPGYAEAHYNLGLIYSHQRRWDESIEEFQKFVKQRPGSVEGHLAFATVLNNQGRRDEAIGQYQLAVRLRPADARAHVDLGIALAKQGRRDQAVAEFQEALRLKPNDPEAQTNLDAALSLIRGSNRRPESTKP